MVSGDPFRKENQMKKPFVWMMTDSTRTDMLGCYGHAAMNTPPAGLAGDGRIAL